MHVQLSSTFDPALFPRARSLPPKPASRVVRGDELEIDCDSTDTDTWLRNNRPNSPEELTALRNALDGRRSCGHYRIVAAGSTLRGQERFKLAGSIDAVLIVSDKARHYLLRKLCRYRKRYGFQ
jgi:hypothetical protein